MESYGIMCFLVFSYDAGKIYKKLKNTWIIAKHSKTSVSIRFPGFSYEIVCFGMITCTC